MNEIAFGAAFFAGLASFFSPCIFPLLPVYLSIIAPKDKELGKFSTLLSAFSFILGFTVVFTLMGMTASFLGEFFFDYQEELRKAGAVFMVFMGFVTTGIISFKFMAQDRRPFLNVSTGSSFLLGMAFVFGWIPCTGPVLATILMYAGVKSSVYYGAYLLLIYSAGFSVPLLVVALATEQFSKLFRMILLPYLNIIQKMSGIIMIIIGVMLYFDYLTKLIMILS